jgi:hypothetical protein
LPPSFRRFSPLIATNRCCRASIEDCHQIVTLTHRFATVTVRPFDGERANDKEKAKSDILCTAVSLHGDAVYANALPGLYSSLYTTFLARATVFAIPFAASGALDRAAQALSALYQGASRPGRPSGISMS